MCFTYPAWLIAGGIGVGLWVRRPGVVGRIMILVLAAAAWIPLGRIQSIAGNRRADRNFEYVMGSLQRGEVPRDNVLEEKSDPWPMFDEEMSYELVYQDTFFGDYDYSIILEDGRAYIFSFYEEKLGRWRVRIRLHDSGDKKPVDK